MIGRVALLIALMWSPAVWAQDVPGIEICTVEKTMERRTSCLQSNVDFLVKTLNRFRGDTDQKLEAANRQIAAMRASLAEVQKSLADLKAAKTAPTPPPTPPAKDAPSK